MSEAESAFQSVGPSTVQARNSFTERGSPSGNTRYWLRQREKRGGEKRDASTVIQRAQKLHHLCGLLSSTLTVNPGTF